MVVSSDAAAEIVSVCVPPAICVGYEQITMMMIMQSDRPRVDADGRVSAAVDVQVAARRGGGLFVSVPVLERHRSSFAHVARRHEKKLLVGVGLFTGRRRDS